MAGSDQPWFGLLDPQYLMTLEGYPGLEIPLDSQGTMRVSFARSPESLRAVSAADVMTGQLSLICYETPGCWSEALRLGWPILCHSCSGAAYGVELQARLLASLLDVDIPYTPAGAPLFLSLACLIYGALLYALVSCSERLAVVGLPIAAVLARSWLRSPMATCSPLRISGWVGPCRRCSGAVASHAAGNGTGATERSRVFNNLNSYLPDSVARDMHFHCLLPVWRLGGST